MNGSSILPCPIEYANQSGRIVARPVRGKDGLVETFDIEELWPKRQWEDKEALGVGRFHPKDNVVSRRMRWNGKIFEPRTPGPSTILR